MPAPWGANQPPWLCKGQKGQCTTRWLERGHRADEAVGFVSYVFGVHPARCHPPVELLNQHQPGPPLGLPTELTPFKIYPVFGLAMPLHLMCNPKYEKNPLNTSGLAGQVPACPLFLWAEHLSPSNKSPSHAHQFRWTTISSTSEWWYSVFTLLAKIRGCPSPCACSTYSLDSQDDYSQKEYSQDEYSYMVLQHSFLAETAMFPNA